MQYRRLGSSGLQVSEFSFGAWVTFAKQAHLKDAVALMALAYEHGVSFFDNAEGYEKGNAEKVMGDALAELNWRRDTYLVSSKVFWGGDRPNQKGLSRKHVTEACDAALRRLRVDYLDLFFCHRPDVDTPIEETVRAMTDLVRSGKVLYWGTSEWNAQQLTEAWGIARAEGLVPPTMEQPQYNMFERQKVEADYLPVYRLLGLGTTIWSPLASGILTGKYLDGIPEGSRMALPGYEWLRAQLETDSGKAKLEKTRALADLAREIGVSLSHLALLWCLRNPHVSTVILGASRPEQLRDNLEALNHRAALTEEVTARIETILGNRPEGPRRY